MVKNIFKLFAILATLVLGVSANQNNSVSNMSEITSVTPLDLHQSANNILDEKYHSSHMSHSSHVSHSSHYSSRF